MTAASDLTVVIPTRDRWAILEKTLTALRGQSVGGFETIVVVDGTDQQPPPLRADRVLIMEHGGPGAARNFGARSTDRPLLLFLGDDMVPAPRLVERHLDQHREHPASTDAVLGRIEWHPDVPDDRLTRWISWSGTQFDYLNITGDDAGWGRLYSSNVSLKRDFFLGVGGFDEDFAFDYEDLDLGWRLHEEGLRLWYERDALAHHLHPYDWERVVRRYESRARGERYMQQKHDWFRPFFADIVADAVRQPRVPSLWPIVADRVPARATPLLRLARKRANWWYHQRIAPRFLAEWEGTPERDELREYLGDEFDGERLRAGQGALYEQTAMAIAGFNRPYLADLGHYLRPASRLLDYGCGIGTDGLRLMHNGHRVAFADTSDANTKFLRWRLARRGLDAPVYDVEHDDIPGGFDAVFSLGTIEHVEDPFGFLAELERRASLVMVEVPDADPNVGAVLDHAASLGILQYRRYRGRSHLVIYLTRRPRVRGRIRSVLQRRLGAHLAPRV